MPWNPTNANDVTLRVTRIAEDGDEETLVDTGAIVVDEFSIESEEDLESLSGVGNIEALGISRGDVEHSFSFTVQGEDADLFQSLATGQTDADDTRSVELEILAMFDQVNIALDGAYAGTRNVSGSSGDAIELEVEGLATGRRTVTNSE